MTLTPSLYREALRKYMPPFGAQPTVGLTVLALVYLAAQTELGRASSGGISPLVVATAIQIVVIAAMGYRAAHGRVMQCEKVLRDAVIAVVVAATAALLALVILLNSDIVAARVYTGGALAMALVYLYGVFRREFLADYLIWPWRGLHRGMRAAAGIMALMFLTGAVLSEYFIHRDNVGAWVLMRIVWPLAGLKIAHAVIIWHQLWLRRQPQPVAPEAESA